MTEALWDAVKVSTAWLDEHNGRDEHQITMRILKLMEESGEAAAAWIGATGNNPRKRVHATREQTAAELADVVLTALVAIEALGFDARSTVDECARKVLGRIGP